jgi:hypothetical protein
MDVFVKRGDKWVIVRSHSSWVNTGIRKRGKVVLNGVGLLIAQPKEKRSLAAISASGETLPD